MNCHLYNSISFFVQSARNTGIFMSGLAHNPPYSLFHHRVPCFGDLSFDIFLRDGSFVVFYRGDRIGV